MHVGKVFTQEHQSPGPGGCGGEELLDSGSTNTPTDITPMEEKEFGAQNNPPSHFNFPTAAN